MKTYFFCLLFSSLFFLNAFASETYIEGGANRLWAEQQCRGSDFRGSFDECVDAKMETRNPFKPFINRNGHLVYGELLTASGRDTITKCGIQKAEVLFWGEKPFCKQRHKCQISLPGSAPYFIDEIVTFWCPISSASIGCSKSPWQNCALDETLPKGFQHNKCLSSQSGPVPRGCPRPSIPTRKKVNQNEAVH